MSSLVMCEEASEVKWFHGPLLARGSLVGFLWRNYNLGCRGMRSGCNETDQGFKEAKGGS